MKVSPQAVQYPSCVAVEARAILKNKNSKLMKYKYFKS